jgi:hypothetical protein
MKLIWTGIVSLIAAFAVPVIAAAEAPKKPRKAPACITGLRVDVSEDFGADGDEPYLKVNRVFFRAPGSMDDGAVATVNKTVHVGDVVQAWDDDAPDADDFIGSAKVGPRGGTLTWANDDAHYHSFYKRGRC